MRDLVTTCNTGVSPRNKENLMSFKAQYHGTCSDDRCQGHITPGDEVQYSVDGLVHIECPGAEFDLKPTETVCTLCWMVQPCSCEDD